MHHEYFNLLECLMHKCIQAKKSRQELKMAPAEFKEERRKSHKRDNRAVDEAVTKLEERRK